MFKILLAAAVLAVIASITHSTTNALNRAQQVHRAALERALVE